MTPKRKKRWTLEPFDVRFLSGRTPHFNNSWTPKSLTKEALNVTTPERKNPGMEKVPVVRTHVYFGVLTSRVPLLVFLL